jgi:hypothetical protein
MVNFNVWGGVSGLAGIAVGGGIIGILNVGSAHADSAANPAFGLGNPGFDVSAQLSAESADFNVAQSELANAANAALSSGLSPDVVQTQINQLSSQISFQNDVAQFLFAVDKTFPDDITDSPDNVTLLEFYIQDLTNNLNQLGVIDDQFASNITANNPFGAFFNDAELAFYDLLIHSDQRVILAGIPNTPDPTGGFTPDQTDTAPGASADTPDFLVSPDEVGSEGAYAAVPITTPGLFTEPLTIDGAFNAAVGVIFNGEEEDAINGLETASVTELTAEYGPFFGELESLANGALGIAGGILSIVGSAVSI